MQLQISKTTTMYTQEKEILINDSNQCEQSVRPKTSHLKPFVVIGHTHKFHSK